MKVLDFATTSIKVPTSRKITQTLGCCSKLYATTMRVLFCLVCKFIIEQLKSIEYEIDYMTSKTVTNGPDEDELLSDQLFKLQCRHAQISRSKNHLNGCLGFILLFDVSFNIFGVINETIDFISHGYGEHGSWALRTYLLVTVVNHIVSLILVIFHADALNDMVCILRVTKYTVD